MPSTSKNSAPADLLPIAQLVGLFGVRGAFKCRPSGAGEGAVIAGRIFFLDPEAKRSVTAAEVQRNHKRLIVTLAGIASVEDARPLVGSTLYLPREQLIVREGEFLDDDLIGLRLHDVDNRELGVVVGVEHYPAQDCLRVAPGNVLVPLVKAFIRTIDLSAGRIVVTLPEGLMDARFAEEA